MPLRYNNRTDEFIVLTHEAKRAEEAGLTLSTSRKGPNGEPCYFTDSAYAALPFFHEADEESSARLAKLWVKYEKSWASESPNTYPYGQGAKDLGWKPMNYQNGGVDYMLEQDNTIVGDGMGLGKSAEGVIYDNVKGHTHNLIVCPANVRLNWRKEILLWSTLPQPRIYPILKSSDGVNPYADYTIVSYELAQNPQIHQALFEQSWDSIHLDEVHYAKSNAAKRTHALYGGGRGIYAKQPLIERAKSTIGYTGTLLPNRPRECFTTIKALGPWAVDYASEEEFAFRYNPRGQMGNGHWVEAKGRLLELQARLRCNLMLRRLQEHVLKELPDKRYELTYIEPTGEISNVLRQERMLNFRIEDLKNPFAEIWGQISTLRKMMGLAALPRMIEHIRFLLDVAEVDKLVVFSWHREVMDKLRAALEDYGVVEVRGGMSAIQKQASVDNFISDPSKRLFSGQLLAAGTGIDGLQRVCKIAVNTEPDWVPGVNEQAAHRIYRLGQHDNVIIQLMCVEGSLLERILAANFTKIHATHSVLDDRIQQLVEAMGEQRLAA